MKDFAKDLEFEKAAAVRDKIGQLKGYLLEVWKEGERPSIYIEYNLIFLIT